jgi:hypothetical protein
MGRHEGVAGAWAEPTAAAGEQATAFAAALSWCQAGCWASWVLV